MIVPDLSAERINEIRQAFHDKGIVYSGEIRQNLLNGIHLDFVARLPVYPGPSYQLLTDLKSLNSTYQLEDGQVPLKVWLENAANLFANFENGNPFQEALAELDAFQDPKAAAAASPASQPQAVQPFSSVAELVAQHTALLQSDNQSKEKVLEFVNRGVQTGTRLENTDDRLSVQSLLNYWLTVLYRIDGEGLPDAVLADYVPPTDQNFEEADCPYVGLSPFQEEDKDSFFGRDLLTKSIVKKIQEEQLVVLVGPSGSGKTSVLQAGVLPALKNGEGLQSTEWGYFPSLNPGSEPLKTLAALFTEDVQTAADKLWNNPEYLVELMNDPNFGGKPAVLVIDQFEELFTICKDDQRREKFLDALLSLKGSPIKHRVILTMRSDQINQLIRRDKLKELFRAAEMRVYPMREDELYEVIKKPAEKIGLKFEAGVIEQLLREIFGDPIGLPLLQFALMELWDDRECNKITRGAMLRLGTCRDALVRKAETFFESCTPDEKTVVRRILLKMVRLSDTWEAATEPVRLEDLYRDGEDRERVNLVLRKLLGARVARISNVCCRAIDLDNDRIPTELPNEISSDNQFELAHQSLARYWPKITEWFTDLREALVVKRRLELFASNWVILGHSDKGLMDKYQLHEAETWLASEKAKDLGYDPDVKALTDRSRQAIAHDKRVRLIALIFVVGVILFAIGAVLTAEHRRLKVATSSRLALEADGLRDRNLNLALLLNLEALRKDSTNPGVQNSLMRAVTSSCTLAAFLNSEEQPSATIGFSSDGQTLFALDRSGQKVRSWDTRSHAAGVKTDTPVPKTKQKPDVRRRAYLLSPDGENLLFMDTDGGMVSWNKSSNEQTAFVPNQKIQGDIALLPAAYSNDSGKLAWIDDVQDKSGSPDKTKSELRVWDLKNKKQIVSKVGPRLSAIAFSPDDKMLAALKPNGDILLTQVADLKQIGKPLANPSTDTSGELRMVFSSNGQRLAFLYAGGTIGVWDVQTQKQLNTFLRGTMPAAEKSQAAHSENDYKSVTTFALDRAGENLVAGYKDGSIVFWGVKNEFKGEYSTLHKSEVIDIVFSPDGSKLLTIAAKGSPELWVRYESAWPDEEPFYRSGELRTGHNYNLSKVAFAPDSKLIAAASEGGPTVLWNLDQRLPGEQLQSGGAGYPSALTAEGHLYLLNVADQITELDIAKNEEVRNFSIHLDWLGTGAAANTLFVDENGTVMVVFYFGNNIALWDPKTGTFRGNITTIPGQNNYGPLIHGLTMDITGKKLVVASDDNKLRIWDLATSKYVSIDYNDPSNLTLALSSDGAKLATCDQNGRLSIWDTATGKPIEEGIQTEPESLQLEFTKDGSKLLQLANKELQLLDPKKEWKAVWKAAEVSRFVFHPVARQGEVAITTTDGSIAFLNLADGMEQFRFPRGEIDKSGNGNTLTTLLYGPKGAYLVAGYFDGSISSILLDSKTWMRRACRVANRPLTPEEQTLYKLSEDQVLSVISWVRPPAPVCSPETLDSL